MVFFLFYFLCIQDIRYKICQDEHMIRYLGREWWLFWVISFVYKISNL